MAQLNDTSTDLVCRKRGIVLDDVLCKQANALLDWNSRSILRELADCCFDVLPLLDKLHIYLSEGRNGEGRTFDGDNTLWHGDISRSCAAPLTAASTVALAERMYHENAGPRGLG